METKNLLAVLAIGVFFIGIVLFSGCSGLTTHTECNDEGKCVDVEGIGIGQCTEDADCVNVSHLECNDEGKCVEVTGSGDDECETDDDCVTTVTHKECVDEVCTEVE
ncbi:MAG: hypothetical protein JSW73_02890, partial [Candidatus Woesearchaeota archaeon]